MATSILPGTTRSGGHARTYKLGAGLRMRGATSGRVGILPPATITDYDLTLPAALGASDKLLQVSSAGVVSLVDPVTIGGTGTELLYRGGASSAAAVAGSSWNGTRLTLPSLRLPASTWSNQGTISNEGAGAPGNKIVFATHSLNLYSTGGATDSVVGMYHGSNLKASAFVSGFAVYASLYAGNGAISATPAAGYLRGTGGSGTNIVGGTLYIGPGPSTGNGTPSAVVIQSTVAGTSGSTAQTLVDTLTVSGGKAILDYARWQNATTGFSNFDGTEVYLDGSKHFLIYNWEGDIVLSATATNKIRIKSTGVTIGNASYTPLKQCTIISETGDCLRLLYGSTANDYYTDFAVSSAGNLTVTPSGGLASLVGDFAVASTNYHYWGASNVDGSWRIGRSGDDFVIERRESGVWVTKSTISA